MPILTINNIPIYYEQHGTDGDDLILIGGLTSDHQVWKSTLRYFSAHFRVLIFDNRGAGQSGTPDFPYTTELMATDALQLMDALKISRAHIIGHSMGGCIAQQMALIAPDKINKMIIMCSRAKPSAFGAMVLLMRKKLQSLGITDDVLAEYMMPFLFSEAFLKNTLHLKGFIQWTMRNPHPQTAAGFSNQLQAVLNHNVFEKLNMIEAETLVIAGDEDLLMPVRDAKIIAESLKNCHFISIPHCAHMPHVEKSKEFVDAVLGFIQ
ncbi:MAG: alpha/beta hydrolase [Gammaproteobacteria bacterium]|nr:alpha/beta hydrolase [Gammaproteobacteria bacterium]